MEILKSPVVNEVEVLDKVKDPSRRHFFKLAGGIAGTGVLLAACHPRSAPTNIYIGSGDTALLNFLYVLEQLEAAFYTQAAAVSSQYYGISHLELLALIDVRDQEIAHKEYLQGLLGKNAITAVVPNFSTVNFADRTSVLTNAATLEDIVIAGFNAAAGLFTNYSYAQSFTKMVSVEARHSAYFRDALSHNSFTDSTVVDSITGLSITGSPASVLASAQQFLTSRFDSSNLPN